MSKLLLLRGLPASGKSTHAEELVLGGGNWVRVNRDLLRTMLHFDKWSGKNEDVTVMVETEIAIAALMSNYNVVVDDTNLSEKHVELWQGVAKKTNTAFERKVFSTPWHECIKRDSKREKKVGRHVIMNMAMQYNLIPEMQRIVICDIDGTVADCEHRLHYLENEPKDWKGFFSEMGRDMPRLDVYEDASDYAAYNDAELIFVSARPETYRAETEEWLRYYGMDYMHLIMRPAGDRRPDAMVKEGILKKYLSNYEILRVWDDRPVVIDMWRENGLDVVDCGDGVYF